MRKVLLIVVGVLLLGLGIAGIATMVRQGCYTAGTECHKEMFPSEYDGDGNHLEPRTRNTYDDREGCYLTQWGVEC